MIFVLLFGLGAKLKGSYYENVSYMLHLCYRNRFSLKMFKGGIFYSLCY